MTAQQSERPSPVKRSRLTSRPLFDPGYAVLVCASIFLWGHGYPRPHVDDLFFTGASVQLAQNARLTNPWISPWLNALGTDHFFCMPPVLPYALALWVKCFGLCTATLTSFHIGVQLLLQMIVYRAIRTRGGSVFVGLIAAAVTWLFAINYGLRPDALAMLLIAIGLLAFLQATSFGWFAGGLLTSSAVLTHPLALAFAFPSFLLAATPVVRDPPRFSRMIGWTFVGAAIAGGMFLVEIDGRFGEFWRTINAARAVVSAPAWYLRPAELVGSLRVGQERWFYGVMLAFVGLSVWRVWKTSDSPAVLLLRRFLWAWLATGILGVFLYPGRALHYLGYAAVILFLATFASARHAWVAGCAALLLVAAHSLGALAGLARPITEPDGRSIRERIKQERHEVLCIDEVAARFVFDFRLPAGTRDWLLRQSPFLGPHGRLADKPAGELWIVNEWKLEHYVADSHVHARRLAIGPLVINSLPATPYRLQVIP